MNFEDGLTVYTRAKVRDILQNKYYCDYAMTEEARVAFGGYAADTVSCFLKLFMSFKKSCTAEKDVDLCCAYMFDDKETTDALANKYNLTQDNVKRIIKECREKLRYAYNFENVYLNDIDDALSKIPEEGFVHFIAFGFLCAYSRRMTLFILECMFNELSESVLSAADGLIYGDADYVPDEEADAFISNAYFPSDARAKINFGAIANEERPIEFHGQEKLFLRLSQSRYVKKIIRYPELVYCGTRGAEHKPHCCLQTLDGKIILIVISPVPNMAAHYNLKRFRALHAYCKENGLGYIITDGKLNTIFDIKNIKPSERLNEALFGILDKNGRITKEDLNKLKRGFEITDSVIASFVINNKLKFTLNPYEIKYFEN